MFIGRKRKRRRRKRRRRREAATADEVGDFMVSVAEDFARKGD